MSGTSNISLRQFREIAKQDREGDVRLSRDTPDRLVNKGTLGQMIATVFENIGQALHLVGDSRRERQELSLQGFKDSLLSSYGDDITKKALHEAGLDETQTGLQQFRFTGDKILRALDHAQGLRNTEISEGRDQVLSEGLYQSVLDDFRSDLDQSKLGPQSKEQLVGLFKQRLEDRAREVSDLYGRPFEEGEIKHLARTEAQLMFGLLNHKDGDKTFSLRLWEDSLKEDSQRLLEPGTDVDWALKRLMNSVNKLDEMGGVPSDSRTFSQSMFAREVSRLVKNQDGTVNERQLKDLAKVQGSFLKPGSPLIEAYRETDDPGTKLTIEGMIRAMARVLGPLTGSVEGDVARLKGPQQDQ
jgi:hypothetical protein